MTDFPLDGKAYVQLSAALSGTGFALMREGAIRSSKPFKSVY
ncbi:hypothetical protein [Rhizobium mesosinicum]|nr:hypothetical protein [Rhizobium mesosinicum]